MIRKFHKILKNGTSDSRKYWFNIGEDKKLSNQAGSMKIIHPQYLKRDMKKLFEWYNSLDKITINEIIEFHSRFEKFIHFKMETEG